MKLQTERKGQLLFVDSKVKDCEKLSENAAAHTEVIILKDDRDGIEQISETLQQRHNIAAVHILSHGAAGSVQIGATELNLDNIETYRDRLEKWFALAAVTANSNSRITAKPEILLYGCNVAATETGLEFVQRLSQLTGANIAASNNLTGNAALGGDWELQITTGEINTAVAFSQEAREAYNGVLETYTATDFTSLRNAILFANVLPNADDINITGNITFPAGQVLPIITTPVNFVGSTTTGITIDGANQPIFFVDNATVNLSNLTIANGRSQGAPGTAGGGGGAGLGGALFINGGNVNIDNVTFSNNQAIGGDGGPAGSTGRGGSSGLAQFFTTSGNSGIPGGAATPPSTGATEGTGPSGATGGIGGTGGTSTANPGQGGDGGGGGSGAPGGNGGIGGLGTGATGPGGRGGAGGIGINGGGGGAGGAGGSAGGAGGIRGAGGNGGNGALGGGGGPGGAAGAVGTATTNPGNGGLGGNLGPTTGTVGGGGSGFTPGTGGFGGNGQAIAGGAGGGGAGLGGAIFLNSGTLRVSNSTFSSSRATGGAAEGTVGATPGQGLGGAIFVNQVGAIATLTNTTIASDPAVVVPPLLNATTNGGAIFNNAGTLTLNNTLVVNNTQTAATQVAGLFTNNTSFIGTAPVTWLGPLQNNGGLISTHALLANAPTGATGVINAGTNANAVNAITGAALTTDQRGTQFSQPYARIVNGTVDIGAYEYGPTIVGQKFNDSNGNGVKDGTVATVTTPAQNFVIYVDTNNNDLLDTTEKRTTVAIDGTYTLADTKTNSPIKEVAVTGWQQTLPVTGATPYNTGVADAAARDFGNFRLTTISGKTYTDIAGNATLDPTDTTLNGVTVNLYRDTNDGILQTATDKSLAPHKPQEPEITLSLISAPAPTLYKQFLQPAPASRFPLFQYVLMLKAVRPSPLEISDFSKTSPSAVRSSTTSTVTAL